MKNKNKKPRRKVVKINSTSDKPMTLQMKEVKNVKLLAGKLYEDDARKLLEFLEKLPLGTVKKFRELILKTYSKY